MYNSSDEGISVPMAIAARLSDRDPASIWDTDLSNVSSVNPVIIWYNFTNATNVSWFRFYYNHPNGTDFAPVIYSVYNNSVFLEVFNQTVSMNGQWVRCNLTNEIQYCKNFSLHINRTLGYVLTHNVTRVSIAELQLFNYSHNPFAKVQESVFGFLDTSYYWNGLSWVA